MNSRNPYLAALAIVKEHPGTGSQGAMAKCILSLWNSNHPYSIGEILIPLDRINRVIVLSMIAEYSRRGESAELHEAGEWVFENLPRLVEMSRAMHQAKQKVKDDWEVRRNAELRRLNQEDQD